MVPPPEEKRVSQHDIIYLNCDRPYTEFEGRRRRGMTEDEMVGWHHRPNRHEFVIVKDREAWLAAVHSVAKSCTRLTD